MVAEQISYCTPSGYKNRKVPILNVRWSKANGAHGDRFAIEFKTENIIWKSTSSKKVSLIEKLNQAKYQLAEFYKQYPYLDPNNPEKLAQENKLNDSFEKIIKLAT